MRQFQFKMHKIRRRLRLNCCGSALTQLEELIRLHPLVPRPLSIGERWGRGEELRDGYVEFGRGMAKFKQGLTCVDEPLHGLCSMTVAINFQLLKFSTSPPPVLGCVELEIIIWASIISSPSDTSTCDRWNTCIMSWSSTWTIRGGGLASTTQGDWRPWDTDANTKTDNVTDTASDTAHRFRRRLSRAQTRTWGGCLHVALPALVLLSR